MAENHAMMLRIFLAFLLAFLLSVGFTKYLIKKEHQKHISQSIKDDIVYTHQSKKKTATMGGIAIFVATWLTSLICGWPFFKDRPLQALMILSVSFFCIGFIDDYLKIKMHNGKGLSGKIRFFSEIAIVLLLLLFLGYDQKSKWLIHIFSKTTWHLGALFVPFLIVLVVGSANAVNLTDGLDGLASGLMLMALAPFLLIALINKEWGIAIFLMSLIGGVLGFLCFNFHPAQIFMGDVGSLPLGAIIALVSFLLGSELLLVISGGIFIVETLSVILQVACYKTTRKRLFKMSPLHHHFEMKGMAEWKVVMVFYVVGFLLSVLATILEVLL